MTETTINLIHVLVPTDIQTFIISCIIGQVVCFEDFRTMVRDSTFAGDVLSEILKLGVLLKLEEMFGTNVVNVQELWITGRVVSVPNH